MNCIELRPMFQAYIDNELDLVRSLDVEHHLKECARCAAARNSLLALRSALQQTGLSYSAPASLYHKVRRIAAPEREEVKTPRRINWLPWMGFSVAAFAALLLFVHPAGMSDNEVLMNDAVNSHVRSLMVNHLMDVVSTDQHTVKPWFNGKIDFAPDVKDFASQGFPLVGGRLDYLDGRTVAALIYHRNKHIINVFVWPAAGNEPSGTESLHGYSVINREAKGLHYCLVSDLNPQELTDLANLVSGQAQ
jgi:anti-sigma factor RsiW